MRTIEDMIVFMALFFVALAMFGSSMFMLQNNVSYGGEHFIEETFKNSFFLDLLWNQYMISLGEF